MNIFQRIDELQHQIIEATQLGFLDQPQGREQDMLVYRLFSGWFEDEVIEEALRDSLKEALYDDMTQPAEEWVRHQVASLDKVIEHGKRQEA